MNYMDLLRAASQRQRPAVSKAPNQYGAVASPGPSVQPGGLSQLYRQQQSTAPQGMNVADRMRQPSTQQAPQPFRSPWVSQPATMGQQAQPATAGQPYEQLVRAMQHQGRRSGGGRRGGWGGRRRLV